MCASFELAFNCLITDRQKQTYIMKHTQRDDSEGGGREGDRQTDRQRDTDTERDTQRQRRTQKQADTHEQITTERERDRDRDRQR